MTDYPNGSQATTCSQTKDPNGDTIKLENRASSRKLMKENENYFTVFLAQMLRMAAEQLSMTPAPPLLVRKKAWEEIEIMAKLMQGQVWKSREDGLREELVAAVLKAVDEKLVLVDNQMSKVEIWATGSTNKMKTAMEAFEKVADRMEKVAEETEKREGEAPLTVEDGEIPQTQSCA
ncbi:hypothetical protein BT96DRAFT_1005363 [Gymnopus androsaceus JB14]|uniref:Uncharacterized protein n=1 Tax=Gymnopus androsaceus JB14 TaxID=1447944 RepID=A0A6A4GPL5_9AGAR|nr:hypothetical protein BT96DRAFT_1005363 [Gymnopus androsaceus JB14]